MIACQVVGCLNIKLAAKGLCKKHYSRKWKHGTTNKLIHKCVDCNSDYEKNSNRQVRCAECQKTAPLKRASDWYVNNKPKKQKYDEIRRSEKRHLYREASKRFRGNNPDKKKLDSNIRRRRHRQATPAWADSFLIKEVYHLAQIRTKITGIQWHVDHIIPLKHKLVCGLHVPENLQVITERENLIKNNSWGESR